MKQCDADIEFVNATCFDEDGQRAVRRRIKAGALGRSVTVAVLGQPAQEVCL